MADAQSSDKISASDLALLSNFNKRIEAKLKAFEVPMKEWDRNRKYVRYGQETPAPKDTEEVRSNLILGVVQTLMASYYAKNPDVEVRPEKKILESNYPALDGFCKTLELVIHKIFVERAHLKKRITRSISSAFSSPASWLKVSYQRDFATDPLIVNRIADAQENMAKLDADIAAVEKGEAGDLESKKAEIEYQLLALQGQVEVAVQEGLVIDRALFEEVLILDDSLSDFAEYDQAKAIVHLVAMTEDDIKARFKVDKVSGTRYSSKAIESNLTAMQSTKDGKPSFYRVAELWSREHQTIFTFCLGSQEWLKAPHQLERNGERFYPFFALYFDVLDGDDLPLPPVAGWIPLQDEYIRMRTQQAQARADNVPGFMYRKNGHLTDKDVNNLANRKGNRFIGVETNGAEGPLSADIAPFPTVEINPAAYDPTAIVRDLEQASGASDASRQMIMTSKTATEAQIADQGMNARTSARVANIEEIIEEMARYSAQILLFEMTQEQVQEIAGEGYVWPQLPRKEIYSMISISIRAGTSGKPDEKKERDQWTALAPELANLIKEVAAMRQGGMAAEAQALIDIFKETLRRFDERLDIEKYFTQDAMALPPAMGGMPVDGAPMQQDGAEAPPPVAQMPMGAPVTAPPGGMPVDAMMMQPVDPAMQGPGAVTEVATALGGLLNQGQVQITDMLGQIAQSNTAAIQTQAMASQEYAGQISQAVNDMRAVAESLMQAQATQQEALAAMTQAITIMAQVAAAPKIPKYDRMGTLISVTSQLEGAV